MVEDIGHGLCRPAAAFEQSDLKVRGWAILNMHRIEKGKETDAALGLCNDDFTTESFRCVELTFADQTFADRHLITKSPLDSEEGPVGHWRSVQLIDRFLIFQKYCHTCARTNILSAFWTVLRRWAIVIEVRPSWAFSRASCTTWKGFKYKYIILDYRKQNLTFGS